MTEIKKIRITTVSISIGTVVLLFGLIFASQVDAQSEDENSDTQEALTTYIDERSVASESLGFTTEFINDPSGSIPGDFVVGPGRTVLEIEPGQTKIAEIVLTNRIGKTRTFNLEVEDATGTNDPARPVALLGDERGPYTLKDYIDIPEANIVLEHNQRARIPVAITIPTDAEPGGRYGSVLVTTVSDDSGSDGEDGAAPKSPIISRIGTLFFITIPGDIEVSGEVSNFSLLPDKKFLTDGPVNFQILYENTGSLHLSPYGDVQITNMFGEEVGFVELDPWFALPKSLRSREIEWNRELLMGKYTAVASINRGYDDIIDTKTISFWVIPLKLVVVVFGGLFLFFLVIRMFLRTFELKRKSS